MKKLHYKLGAVFAYCSREKRLRLEARSLHSRGRMARERTSKTGIRAAERTNGQTGNETTGNEHASSCGTALRVLRLPVLSAANFSSTYFEVSIYLRFSMCSRVRFRFSLQSIVFSILKRNKCKKRRGGKETREGVGKRREEIKRQNAGNAIPNAKNDQYTYSEQILL